MKIHTSLVLVLVSLLKNSLGQTGCPTGWLSFQSKCIIAVEGQVTYSNAMDICANDNNGELLVAEPYGLYQNFIANTLLPDTTSLYFYIGLDKIDSADFVWIGDIVPSEFFWGPNQPFTADSSQICVAAQNDGSEALWFDFTCATPAGYICQRTVDLFCGSGSAVACQNGGTCAEGLTGSICSCTAGWTGDMCEIDINECIPTSPCGTNEDCDNTPGSFSCECQAGFLRDDFGNCVELQTCSSEQAQICDADSQICVNVPEGFECRCRPGYRPTSVVNSCIDIDECLENPCTGVGFLCTNTPGSFSCECIGGFFSNRQTGNCEDIDECLTDGRDAECQLMSNSVCVNTMGSYFCGCSDGFVFNNDQCLDIDECLIPDTCSATEDCQNLIGSYRCDCKAGFSRQNNVCTDVDDCPSETCTRANTVCENIPGSFRCVCDVGYTDNGVITQGCVDIDECAVSAPCSLDNQVCMNTDGSFTCRCRDGYTMMGNACIDVDDCNPGLCSEQNERCVDRLGSHECVCNDGYVRTTSGTCRDRDECFDESICGDSTKVCMNTEGSYTCMCLSGYTEDSDGGCEDINECDSNPCDPMSQVCRNFAGGHSCNCASGFELNNSDCLNINDCADDSCPTTLHVCIDLVNGFECQCMEGYESNAANENVCRDKNECEKADVCSLNEDCTNTVGSFSCDCSSGYQRSAVTGNCAAFVVLVLQISMINGERVSFEETKNDVISSAYNTTICEVVYSRLRFNFPTVLGCNVGAYREGSVIALMRIPLEEPGIENQLESFIREAAANGVLVSGDGTRTLNVNSSSIYIRRPYQLCLVFPCSNGGTCMENVADLSPTCTCPIGFSGSQCEGPGEPDTPAPVYLISLIILPFLVITAIVFIMIRYKRKHVSKDKKATKADDGGDTDYVNAGMADDPEDYIPLEEQSRAVSSSKYEDLNHKPQDGASIPAQYEVAIIPQPQKPEATPSYHTRNVKGVNSGAYKDVGAGSENRQLPVVSQSHPSGDEDEDSSYVPDRLEEYTGVYINIKAKPVQPGPIKVAEFQNFMSRNKEDVVNDIVQQFMALPSGGQYPWSVALKFQNKPRNFFKTILAYDHSRVKLDTNGSDARSDYINASYIKQGKTSFIAAQGPQESTVDDFWKMVWQENVETIVMVTDNIETNKLLCCTYWPKKVHMSEVFDDITVLLMESTSYTTHTIRKLNLLKGDHKTIHTVTQVQVHSWPYGSVPKEPASLIPIVKKVKSLQTDGSSSPLLVHCSNGIGATGTFMAVYVLMDTIKKNKDVNVFDFVKNMRDDRVDMVQTRIQYLFIFECLLAVLQSTDSQISCDQLKKLGHAAIKLKSKKEYKVLQDSVIEEQHCEDCTGNSPENQHKNRFKNIIPVDKFRPVLKVEGNTFGSNSYINAIHLTDFSGREFIITQTPLSSTVEDFWRLVYDYECTTIVMLNTVDSSDETAIQYWPSGGGGGAQYGLMKVLCTNTANRDSCIQSQFKVVHKKDVEKSVSVDHFAFCGWSGNQPDVSRLRQFIRYTGNKNGSVLVHCINGVGLSAVYIIFKTESEKLEQEGSADVFHCLTKLRKICPHAVQTQEEYTLCYQLLKDHLDNPEEYAVVS